MPPFFSLITPTLLRQSLVKTCASVGSQSFTDWEHVVIVDCDHEQWLSRSVLIEDIRHPARNIVRCPDAHKNFGNTCRHDAWHLVQGHYLLYLDDDNFLADELVLAEIQQALCESEMPPVAIFPIHRHGQRFYFMPPRLGYVDTANLLVKRDLGQWPNVADYDADGKFIERLVQEHGVRGFDWFRPIIFMPCSSGGEP